MVNNSFDKPFLPQDGTTGSKDEREAKNFSSSSLSFRLTYAPYSVSELQIRRGHRDNSEKIFLISHEHVFTEQYGTVPAKLSLLPLLSWSTGLYVNTFIV